MGKRSNFARRERDYYSTPASAVAPLLRFLPPRVSFCEPCAGNGALIDHLKAAGHLCLGAWDIEPQRSDIVRHDALECSAIPEVDFFITNPPWDRRVLHPLILNLSAQRPTWLLFDADWMHTKQAVPYLAGLQEIISVGRVKWIPESKHTGKDNCCWYLFDNRFGAARKGPSAFFGRAA